MINLAAITNSMLHEMISNILAEKKLLPEVFSVQIKYTDTTPGDGVFICKINGNDSNDTFILWADGTWDLLVSHLKGEAEIYVCECCGRKAMVTEDGDERWNIGVEFRGEELDPICPECESIFVDSTNDPIINLDAVMKVIKDSSDLDHKIYTNTIIGYRQFAKKIMDIVLA